MTGRLRELTQQLSEAQATISALLSGQIDAVVDAATLTPVLLSKAQASLQESEARYRQIVETTNEGIWMVNAESRITFVNQRLSAMLGYPPAAILGLDVSRLLPPGVAATTTHALNPARASQGISDQIELALQRQDGSELWVLLKTSPIRAQSGEVVGALAMLTDRTEHRKADEALRKSEQQYRQIVEATSDGIGKVDESGRVVFVNGRLAEMLGYAANDMIGAHASSFRGKTPAGTGVLKTFETYPGTIETTLSHRDGSNVEVSIEVSRLVDDAGGITGYLGVVRDVTERKRLLSQLMVSDRMASVGTLAAGVAHEINNPLAAVIANLDYIAETLRGALADERPRPSAIMSDSWLIDEIRTPVEDAHEGAERVRCIVRDLRIFARSPRDEPTGPVDVRAVMESSLRMGWNEIRHRARLVKHYAVVPGVAANEARLGQVFLNLLVNAAQALPTGRAAHNEIRVTVRSAGERVIIEVGDTGAGIAPEIIGRIFDAFFTTKSPGVGTGLGLAICHRIVTDMGGELTVESALGKGATFTVSLPCAAIDDVEITAAPIPAQSAGRRGRILVVDDDPVVLRSIKRVLSKDHDVTTTVSARDALAFCSSGQRFDLVLCDLMMPDMTGMDLHQELSICSPVQAEKMIFLTGGAFTERARKFLSDVPREHLEKPYSATNLRAVVHRYVL